MMRDFIFFILVFNCLFLEGKDTISSYMGEPTGLLTFSENFPIEIDSSNEETIKKERELQFSRNVQIEQVRNFPLKRFFLGIIGGLFLLALIYWPRNNQEKELENPKTVQDAAKLQLKELQLKKIPPNEYYKELILILRNFIEKRYGIHAPKQTTEEFLEHLNKDQTLKVISKSDLGIFLNYADFIKFSGKGPNSEEVKKAYKTVLELIEK